MRETGSHFWVDKALQDHFREVWSKIARVYADDPPVAGYDMLNEPWIHTSIVPYLNAAPNKGT